MHHDQDQDRDGGTAGRRARFACLPPVADAPELTALLGHLEAIDTAQSALVGSLARLLTSGEVEAATGLPVDTWLLAAGVTTSDRRMLTTAVTQLGRLPSVADAFARGVVTWPQVRVICLEVERLPDHLAVRVDDTVAGHLDGLVDADPDQAGCLVRQVVRSLAPDEEIAAVERAERGSFVAFQPRLDGTGARLYGDLDGLGYGLVSAALDAGAPLPARSRDHLGQDPDPAQRRDTAVAAGRHRADRLVQLAADDLARRTGTVVAADVPLAADAVGTGHDGVDRTRAITPQVTLLLSQDQLLGDDRLPVELLTSVTGGRVKVSSATARRWLDEAGARLRTIVLDDTGRVLGVGRRRRFATGWVRDAIEAVHATCVAPGCRAAARIADADHHTSWHPDGDGPAGRTDLDELGPLCRTCHGAKERGWSLAATPDGRRRWSHRRSGLTVTTTPRAVLDADARPPGARSAPERRLHRRLRRGRERPRAPDPGGPPRPPPPDEEPPAD